MALSVALPSGLDSETFNKFSSFGLIELSDISHTSPTPSVSSDSSGIGSLGSLKSDRESLNSESLPPSPQATEKKLFETADILTSAVDLQVQYGGRDILDLWGTIRDSHWQYRAAQLPSNSLAVFMANRSQYHRLTSYGMNVEFTYESCPYCDFTYAADAIERRP